MERSVTVSARQPFFILDENISTGLPSPYQDSQITASGTLPTELKPKAHFLTRIYHRQLQSEILRVEWGNGEIKQSSYHAWVTDMKLKVYSWREAVAAEYQSLPDWFDLRIWLTIVLLHRPCPRCPKPDEGSISTCFDATVKLTDGYWDMARDGLFKYVWLSIHDGFMCGIIILWSLLHYTETLKRRHGVSKIIEVVHRISGLFVSLENGVCSTIHTPGTYDCSYFYSASLSSRVEVASMQLELSLTEHSYSC